MKQPIEAKISVEWRTNDGRAFKANAGNFTYGEFPVEQGGPYKLTLLRGPDRADPDNEPFLMISGVTEIKIGEPIAEAPAAYPDFISVEAQPQGDGTHADYVAPPPIPSGVKSPAPIPAPAPFVRDAG